MQETPFANRPKERSEKQLPSVTCCSTLQLCSSFALLNRESELPTRMYCRSDKIEPNAACSSTDCFGPHSAAWLRTERSAPSCAKFSTERLSPTKHLLKTEMADPTLLNARIEIADPRDAVS